LSLHPETDSVSSVINSLRYLRLLLLNDLVQISMESDKRRKYELTFQNSGHINSPDFLSNHVRPHTTANQQAPHQYDLGMESCHARLGTLDQINQSMSIRAAVQCRCETNARRQSTIFCGRQNLSGRCVNDMSTCLCYERSLSAYPGPGVRNVRSRTGVRRPELWLAMTSHSEHAVLCCPRRNR
jgi:hypothetical protein